MKRKNNSKKPKPLESRHRLVRPELGGWSCLSTLLPVSSKGRDGWLERETNQKNLTGNLCICRLPERFVFLPVSQKVCHFQP